MIFCASASALFSKTILFCLFCRFPFWFLKSWLFCIAPRSFSKTMIYCALFWKMPFSCFGFGKSRIIARTGKHSFSELRKIAPRSSGRFSFGKLEISASLAAGKTDFRIFGKLKRITRRASAKKIAILENYPFGLPVWKICKRRS